MTTTSPTSCQPLYATPRTPSRETLGPKVGLVARRLGKPFLPWQQSVADVAMEVDDDTGQLAYSELGLTVPRQQGKSTFILAKATHRCSATGFFGPRQRLVYTAQTRQKAREKWEEDYAAELEASRVFRHRVTVHKGNGNEHIRFQNGSRFGIEANTEKAGHGGTLDESYIDEAFAQVDWRLEQAFNPAMITRANKLLAWVSTAGWTAGSPYLEEKVKLGRAAVAAGVTRGLCYFEYAAPVGADPGDPATWRSCMPALGYTITEAAILAEYEKAVRAGKLNDFMRAYLNVWVPKPVAVVESIISEDAWTADLGPTSTIIGPAYFAVDVAPDHSWSAVAVAGQNAERRFHVEVTGRGGVLDYRPGTEWLVPQLQDMRGRNPGFRVAMAHDSGAKALRIEIERAGIPVDVLPADDVKAACGLFYAKANAADQLRHIGQAPLTDALRAARKQHEDGEVAWRWGRKRSTGDITALYAATLAVWQAAKALDLTQHPVNNVW